MATTNTPPAGAFARDPGVLDATQVSSIFTSNIYAFAPSNIVATSNNNGKFFLYGDFIPAGYGNQTSTIAQYGGYVPLPVTDLTGKCSDGNYIKFDQTVMDNVCTREVTTASFAHDCNTIYNINYMVGNLKFARLPISVLSDPTSFTAVTITSVESLPSGSILSSVPTTSSKLLIQPLYKRMTLLFN